MYVFVFIYLLGYLLQIFLGMSCTYIIMITSWRGWIIVRVGTTMVCCSGCFFQHQLVFSCLYQRYCALKNNSPAEITCPSIVLFFCTMYASEMNWMTINLFYVLSAVLMAPYIPDWTNDSIFSLILSRTNLCISSNDSMVLILVLGEWYLNCYVGPALANMYSWRQVGSVTVFLTEYQKSKVCQVFMYMQHRHMICGKLHICHELYLDKNVNDYA